PEGSRHPAEDAPRPPLPDDAVDPVYELGHLDATIKQREQRRLVAFMRGVLTRSEADVRGNPRKPLASGRVETREDSHQPHLVRRHHFNGTTLLREGALPVLLTGAYLRPALAEHLHLSLDHPQRAVSVAHQH